MECETIQAFALKKKETTKKPPFLLFIGFVLGDNPFSVWQTENYFFN